LSYDAICPVCTYYYQGAVFIAIRDHADPRPIVHQIPHHLPFAEPHTARLCRPRQCHIKFFALYDPKRIAPPEGKLQVFKHKPYGMNRERRNIKRDVEGLQKAIDMGSDAARAQFPTWEDPPFKDECPRGKFGSAVCELNCCGGTSRPCPNDDNGIFAHTRYTNVSD
jgi:hypothetical protein